MSAAGVGMRETGTREVLPLPFTTQIGHELHASSEYALASTRDYAHRSSITLWYPPALLCTITGAPVHRTWGLLACVTSVSAFWMVGGQIMSALDQ